MLVELVILIAAIGGSTSLTAIIAWLWFRTRRDEGTGGNDGSLAVELERVRAELSEQEATGRLLGQRVEFLERLLEAEAEADPSTGRRSLPAGD